MGHFTIENLKRELHDVEQCSINPRSLELFVLLHKAIKCLDPESQGFTEEDAKEWAKRMTPPARWTMEQTCQEMKKRGYDHNPCEFWIVMNALFSDYGKTMIKYNADKPELWADLAHDFICDADAAPGKVGRYYRDIVEH